MGSLNQHGPASRRVPEPTRVLVTRWAQDEFACGSYSHLGLDASWADRRAIQGRITERLAFAGEAGSEGYAGTVHGAYLSGEAAARELLASPPDAGSGSPDALVLGAGVAGLRAAQVLRAAGWRVRIIEGRERVGGRVHTDTSLGVPIDLGASWVHGPDGNPVAALLLRLNIPLLPTPGDDQPWRVLRPGAPPLTQGEVRRGQAAAARLLEGLRHEQRQGRAESVRQAADRVLAGLGLSALERQFAELVLSQEYELSTSAANLPMRAGNEPFAFPGGDRLPLGGYAPLIEELARGSETLLGQRVLRVQETPQGVTLHTGEQRFSASVAVCTLPLGVLKGGGVVFEPGLPPRVQRAITRLGMGVLDKVVLTFPHKFWPGDTFHVLDAQPRAHGYWLDLTTLTGLPTLVRLVYAPEAHELERRSDADLTAETLGFLESLRYG